MYVNFSYTYGRVYSYFDYEENSVTITDLYVEPEERGKGFSIKLLYTLLGKARDSNIKYIYVDDHSDNYRAPHNIYTKIGLEYVEEKSGEEMKGEVDKSLQKILSIFKQKEFFRKRMEELREKISCFVAEGTIGRPPSHDYHHMEKVSNISVKLARQLGYTDNKLLYTMVVAFLHDYADHKYDKDGQLEHQLKEFLNRLFPNQNTAEYILKCINTISYSKEKKNGRRYFVEILPPFWLDIRNVVSDADKSEALGGKGVERCMSYSVEQKVHGRIISPEEEQSLHQEKLHHLAQHAKDKLLTLPSYFYTKPGMELAKKRYIEMIEEFNRLNVWVYMV